MIAQVPELWDGGYWYGTHVLTDPVEGGHIPDLEVRGWTAEYNADYTYAAVRTPDPILVPDIGVSASDVLDAAKPYGRVWGR